MVLSVHRFTGTSRCEWRYEIDGLPATVPFQQREVFISEVAKYFTIIKCKSMLDGILEGLKYYEVLLSTFFHFMSVSNVEFASAQFNFLIIHLENSTFETTKFDLKEYYL